VFSSDRFRAGLASPVRRRRSEIPCAPVPSPVAKQARDRVAQRFSRSPPLISRNGIRIADRSRTAAESWSYSPSTCAECQQQYGPIRFEQIDAGLDNTAHIPSSSVEMSTPIVNLTVDWR
jgi:hypothetical protein